VRVCCALCAVRCALCAVRCALLTSPVPACLPARGWVGAEMSSLKDLTRLILTGNPIDHSDPVMQGLMHFRGFKKALDTDD
jgi:hypothetical protein